MFVVLSLGFLARNGCAGDEKASPRRIGLTGLISSTSGRGAIGEGATPFGVIKIENVGALITRRIRRSIGLLSDVSENGDWVRQ